MTRLRKLRKKEVRKLIQEIKLNENPPLDIDLDNNSSVEAVNPSSGLIIYLVNSKPSYVKINNNFIPLLNNEKIVKLLNKITVDMGAIPYICNGADVMAPGVVYVSGEFNYGTLVSILDEKHGKVIAIGISVLSSKDIRTAEKGKVVNVLHYVGDKIWYYVKDLI